jgi:hypothetical protein
MRKIQSAHSGENIAKIMISVLEKFDVVPRFGYYIKDNHGANDICLRVICRKLRLNIKNPNNRRVKCLKHILNFTAKAFFFEIDVDSFKEKTN